MEKKFAGFYVTEHPIDTFDEVLKDCDIMEASLFEEEVIDDEGETVSFSREGDVKIAGIVEKCRILYTKKDGSPMKTFVIEDRSGEVDCIMFTKVYSQYGDLIEDGSLLCVKGKYSMRDDRGQIIVNCVCNLDEIDVNFVNAKKIYLKAETKYDINRYREVAANLKTGDIPVLVQYDKKLYTIDEYVAADMESYMELLNVAGRNHILFR